MIVNIKDVRCGGEHTMVLSTFGRLYTFGHGYTGQLGLGNTKNYDKPMIVKSLLKKCVSQIAAGWSHSTVLTTQGFMYVSGCGKYSELGLNDEENRKHFSIVKSVENVNITQIFAGGHHSWLIVDNENPEKIDYDSPSPLISGNITPNKSEISSPRHKDNSALDITKMNNTAPKKLLNTNVRFNLDMIGDKLNNEKYLLQVAYSDLKMSHRFIRFLITNNNYKFKDLSYKELNLMISDYFKNDNAVVLFRLQDDNEIVNMKNPAMDTFFKDLKYNNKLLDTSNKKSFSLVIVYDNAKNNQMTMLKNNIESIKAQNNTFKKHEIKSLCKFIY